MASRKRKSAFEKALDNFESAVRSHQMHNHGVVYPPRYPEGAPPDPVYTRSRENVLKKYRAMRKKWADQVHAARQMERESIDGRSS